MCHHTPFNLSAPVRYLIDITKRKEKTYLCLDRWTRERLIFTRNLKNIFRVKILIVSVHVSN